MAITPFNPELDLNIKHTNTDGSVLVSTVYLMIAIDDYIYETLVMEDHINNPWLDSDGERYKTKEAAIIGHDQYCKKYGASVCVRRRLR